MKKVYVAGAMSADNIIRVLDNLHAGIDAGAELLALGFAPFVPHFDAFFQLMRGGSYKVSMEAYKGFCMEWLLAADAVLVLPGEKSEGVQAEIAEAYLHDIPVFESLNALLNWRDSANKAQPAAAGKQDDTCEVYKRKGDKA